MSAAYARYGLIFVNDSSRDRSADMIRSLVRQDQSIRRVVLLMLGIIGEYIGRIYEETKGRPLDLVREETEAVTVRS